jgi:PAS domain S-box-containing protein
MTSLNIKVSELSEGNSLIDSVSDGVTVNSQGVLLYVNETFAKMVGYSVSELLGMNVLDVTAPEYLEEIKKRTLDRQQGLDVVSMYELELVRKDGARFPAEFSVSRIDYNGKSSSLTIIRDISDRKQIKSALVESEERYRGLFDSLIDGFTYCKAVFNDNGEPVDYTYVEINHRYTEIFGIGREIIGRNVSEVFPGVENDPADWIRLYGEIAKNGGELRFEEQSALFDKWYKISAYSPKPGYFATVFQDITEQKRLTSELRLSEDLFLGFMQSAIDVHILLDKDMRYLDINESWVKQSGMKKEDIIGKNVLEVFPQMKATERYEAYLKVIETGESVAFHEVEAVSARGVIHDIHAFKTGSGLGIISRNVTDRIKYQDQLEALHEHTHSLENCKSVEEISEQTLDIIDRLLDFNTVGFIVREENHMREISSRGDGLGEILIPLGGIGIIAKTVESKESQLIYDAATHPDYFEASNEFIVTQTEMTVPIIVQDNVFGVINIETEVPRAYSENDLKVIEILAKHVSSNIISIWSDEKETLTRTQSIEFQNKLKTLHDHAAALASTESFEEIANITQDYLVQYFEFNIGGLSIVEGDQLANRYVWGAAPTQKLYRPLDGLGIIVEAVNTGRTLNIGDVRDNPLYIDGQIGVQMLSELAVPVVFEGKAIGVINLETEVLDAFTENDQQLVETLASHIAAAYSKIQYNERLTALHNFSLELGVTKSEDEIIDTTFQIMRKVLQLPNASFQILRDNALVTLGVDLPDFQTMVLPIDGKGVTVRAAREARTIRLGDILLDPDFVKGTTDSRSELAVPIMVENQVLGVLNVESDVLDAYSSDDERMMEVLAQNVASALSRVHAAEDNVELERQVLVEQVRVEQEQELGELKTQFISTATHELRTPVTSILGYIELILADQNRNIPDAVREDLEVVFRNAIRLVTLTNDLLDVQRITSGRFDIQPEKNDIVSIIGEILEEMSPLFSEKRQMVDLVSPKEVVVDVDETRISQLFVNLLRNANKFTSSEGNITVSVESGEDLVLISVKDSGIGLSEEDIGKLFVPFPGIRHGLNESSTGLGLAICKGIVDMHDGEIWVESGGHGKGSTITFTLPLTK